jgi:hypothetical protein
MQTPERNATEIAERGIARACVGKYNKTKQGMRHCVAVG